MRVVNQNEKATATTAESFMHSTEASPVTHKSYHELSEAPLRETDALAQLHANLEMLTDLNARVSFLMREVRYLMKV